MLAGINELRDKVMLLADGKLTLKEREKLKSKTVGLTIMVASAKIADEKKFDDLRIQESELDSCVEKLNEIWGIIAKNNLF